MKANLGIVIVMMILYLLPATLCAQSTTIQIGSGTSGGGSPLYGPVYRFSATSTTTHARSNILFSQQELSAFGIFPGASITAIGFEKTNATNFITPADFKVYMGNSLNAILSTTTTWASILSTHSLVYSDQAFNLPNVSGWVMWNITPFVYSGGSLEIATDLLMAGGAGSTNGFWRWTYTDTTSPDMAIGATGTGMAPEVLNGTTVAYKHRANARITFTPGSASQQPQTIDFSNISKIYGAPDFDPGAIASSGMMPVYVTSNPSVATIINGKIHITGAGTTNITASQPGNTNYYPASDVTKVFTVNAATLVVKPDDKSIYQGQPLPALTITYSGFVYNEGATNLITRPTVTTAGTSTSPTGTYPLIAGGGVSANYQFTYIPGTLTILEPGTQSITFADITKIYGASDFDPGAISNSGLPVSYTSNNTAVATIVNSKVRITGAGTALLTASQPGDISFKPAPDVVKTIIVTKTPLTIRAVNITVLQKQPWPAFSVTYAGFVNGETENNLASKPTVSTSATSLAPLGTYPLTASGAVSGNYSITYADGLLTLEPYITPAAKLDAWFVSRSELQVVLDLPVGHPASLALYNSLGVKVYTIKVWGDMGTNVIKIPMGQLLPGVYILNVQGKDINLDKKIIKR